jgi:uncharacterized membrane protein
MTRQLALATIAAAIVMFPLDFLWLRTMRPFYESQMGSIMLAEPRLAAAIAFYLVYAVGVAFFAIVPNLASGTIWTAAGYGAALGLVAYGTYDATNYATLKDFPVTVMIVDWLWGTVLTATVAAAGWYLMNLQWVRGG